MRSVFRLLATTAAALVCSSTALAQAYPDRPIKAVVPFAAGSATDTIGRAFALKMQESLGQTIVVDNKPGASGLLGADAVAKAAPDGYTILIGTNSTNAALKSLMKKLPYDQDTAFAPVAYMGSVPLIMAVNNDVPAKTLKELVDMAKAKPGSINFASASTSQLVSTEMMAGMAGIQLANVPYKSGPAAMTDLIGGVVQMFSADFAVMLPQVKAGKVRGLAVTSSKRSPAVPELPTVNEALGLRAAINTGNPGGGAGAFVRAPIGPSSPSRCWTAGVRPAACARFRCRLLADRSGRVCRSAPARWPGPSRCARGRACRHGT